MTRQPENAMLVDCLRSLQAKIRAKSMFTNLLFFDAFTYVLIHRPIHNQVEIINVDDESDDESADGSDTPQNIRKRQDVYDRAM